MFSWRRSHTVLKFWVFLQTSSSKIQMLLVKKNIFHEFSCIYIWSLWYLSFIFQSQTIAKRTKFLQWPISACWADSVTSMEFAWPNHRCLSYKKSLVVRRERRLLHSQAIDFKAREGTLFGTVIYYFIGWLTSIFSSPYQYVIKRKGWENNK